MRFPHSPLISVEENSSLPLFGESPAICTFIRMATSTNTTQHFKRRLIRKNADYARSAPQTASIKSKSFEGEKEVKEKMKH
ncbi:MAG: hypothetical protein AAF570_14490 [Bacteroidota bacterium]